ncbi:MAG: FAD-dependent oxidoreductase [Phycisphaerales bacterium JB063]
MTDTPSTSTPTAPADLAVDVAVFGGGVAGLWLLDALVRAGYDAILIEKHAMGHGQTVCAQGIIHSGLKYTLKGGMTGSAQAIKEMPALWRRCLEGQDQPDLRGTRIRSDHCLLWRTQSLSSKLGMVGARAGLKVKPIRLSGDEVPQALRACPGGVFRLDEQVIAPESMLAILLQRHRDRCIRADVEDFTVEAGHVRSFHLHGRRVLPKHVVLTAGAGNAQLRRAIGLPNGTMQRRPLHMVMMRSPDLPLLQGHCVDGAKTRATITSDRDRDGQTVWQVGGQISEDGVSMERDELIPFAKREVAAVLPGLELTGVEWASYRIDRAEQQMPGNKRPEHCAALEDGNVLTCWPTKLALAPILAADIIDRLPAPQTQEGGTGILPVNTLESLATMPHPDVAPPPWETTDAWTRDP